MNCFFDRRFQNSWKRRKSYQEFFRETHFLFDLIFYIRIINSIFFILIKLENSDMKMLGPYNKLLMVAPPSPDDSQVFFSSQIAFTQYSFAKTWLVTIARALIIRIWRSRDILYTSNSNYVICIFVTSREKNCVRKVGTTDEYKMTNGFNASRCTNAIYVARFTRIHLKNM